MASRKCSSPCLCPFWHSSTQINAIMIKPEALLILKEKFFSCTCQVVESGVAGLFSGFRTHPINTLVCILVFEEISNFLILNLLEKQERQCGKTLLQYVAFQLPVCTWREKVVFVNSIIVSTFYLCSKHLLHC